MIATIRPAAHLSGELQVPGDKSIAHRALMLGALARGWTRITNLPDGGDVRASARVLGECGARITRNGSAVIVQGGTALDPRGAVLDCANSGTTMRLLLGLLAGANVRAHLTGDESLRRRPMDRVATPLRTMGAELALCEGRAPIELRGGALQGVEHRLSIPSAQVKSALLLAGLRARGRTRLRGAIASRDHTERMLAQFGARIAVSDDEIAIEGGQTLRGCWVDVPGDPSSAAYWIAAALVVPGARVAVHNVLLNPTRRGFLDALQRMGAPIEVTPVREYPEPAGTVRVRYGELRAIRIEPHEVPALLDELPLLAVLATSARGTTQVFGAGELRVKESDRIEAVARNLKAMGAHAKTTDEGFAISGPQRLRGARIDPQGDHRIAMAFAIAALGASGETEIADPACIAVSYPGFLSTLQELCA